MIRIDSSTKEPDKNGPGRDGFDERTPETGPPTALSENWCNHVQEELARTVELDGEELDPNDMEQVARIITAKTRGPSSSDDNRLAAFDGATGKRLKQNTQRIDGHSIRLASDGVYGFTASRQRKLSFHPSSLVRRGTTASDLVFPAGSGVAQFGNDNASATLDLSPHIHPGMSIDQVDVRVLPGAARATNDRVRVSLYYRNTLSVTPSPTLVATAEDNGTTAAYTISLAGPLTSWADSYAFYLLIEAGDDGGVHNVDTIGGIVVTLGQTEVW